MNRALVTIYVAATGLSFAAQAQNVRLVHPLGSDDGNVCTEVPCETIGRAIEVAVPGDIVDIAAGEYTETLTIDKSLTLQGAGQDNITIIQASTGEPGTITLGRVVTISGSGLDVEISDMTIRRGAPPFGVGISQGGGLRVEDGKLTLTNVTVSNNFAGHGAGLYTNGSEVILNGVAIEDNVANDGGGMYVEDGELELTNATFNQNIARGLGTSGGTGGGLYLKDGSAQFLGVEFRENVATRSESDAGPSSGGGMYSTRGSVEMNDVEFIENEADRGNGGGFTSVKTPFVLTDVVFSGNRATQLIVDGQLTAGMGGGIRHAGIQSPTLTRVDFIGNFSSRNGGGLYTAGANSMALTDVTFSENRARNGGGMFNWAGTPLLGEVRFIDNLADNGGGMSNGEEAGPTLTNVVFRGNRASCPPDDGCLFGVERNGGGMWNQNSNPVLVNVVFSGNFTSLGFKESNGGGMYNRESAPRMTNVTFSGNRAASQGGGMFNFNEAPSLNTPIIRNAIFWNNMDGSGIGTGGASIATGGVAPLPNIEFSLVQGAFPGGNGNLDGTDAGNDPLFLNMPDPESAPTLTGNLRLRPESPVIDVGNNAFVDGIDTDLDGNPRIIGSAVDFGPYEFTGEIDDDVIFGDRFEG